jgi:hypothetical protein
MFSIHPLDLPPKNSSKYYVRYNKKIMRLHYFFIEGSEGKIFRRRQVMGIWFRSTPPHTYVSETIS